MLLLHENVRGNCDVKRSSPMETFTLSRKELQRLPKRTLGALED